MKDDVSSLLSRERQLDILGYVLILSLVGVTAIVAFIVVADIPMPQTWLLNNAAFQVFLAVFLIAVMAYLAAQQRRLRRSLLAAHDDLESARNDISAAYDRLSFAYHAAETMTSLARTDGVRVVLAETVQRFGADAAAVVGGQEVELATSGEVDAASARTAVVAAARTGLEDTGDAAPGHAIRAPIRVRGDQDTVLAVWRRSGAYGSDDMEGLRLVARIVELGMENRALLDEVKTQLSGTLQAMVELVERRCPNYIPQSMTVASYAVAVGKAAGMSERELGDLRLAAMLHDIGMLDVPETILSAPRGLTPDERALVATHAKKGADLARLANFGPAVQKAILSHHERVDGTGYPNGLAGPAIPVEARILAVCDSYVAMISDRPYRPRMRATDAIGQLTAGAGAQYDADIVREFVAVRSGDAAESAPATRLPA